MTLTCSECSATITAKAKTGRCRPCAARAILSDPAFAARFRSASAEARRTPEARAKARAISLQREQERKGDPAWRAYKIASGKRLRAEYDANPEWQAANAATRADVGRRQSFRALGWLPDRLREQYVSLRQLVGAAEAKRMTMEELTPFERQLARIAEGARIVAAPDLRTGGPEYTLGGISTGMI